MLNYKYGRVLQHINWYGNILDVNSANEIKEQTEPELAYKTIFIEKFT